MPRCSLGWPVNGATPWRRTRCTQQLPIREQADCPLCGQNDQVGTFDPSEAAVVSRDVKSRSEELSANIAKHKAAFVILEEERDGLLRGKQRIDRELNEASKRYDSAYLANVLLKERQKASVLQEADSLSTLMKLTKSAEKQRQRIASFLAQEMQLKIRLKQARTAAESDATNLDRLKAYYLDCLIWFDV